MVSLHSTTSRAALLFVTWLLSPTFSVQAFVTQTNYFRALCSSTSCLTALADADADAGARTRVVFDPQDYHLMSPEADILELSEGQRLVCVGDVHGDAAALRNLLQVAGVLETKNNNQDNGKEDAIMRWTGGNTILVQTGDILDRGDAELTCWRILAKLSQQAAKAGGAVVVLWGNHEALNCQGQFHYTTGEQEYQEMVQSTVTQECDNHEDENVLRETGTADSISRILDLWSGPPRHQPARQATYDPGTGLLVHPLLAKLKVAVKVGRTLCVHAGLTAHHWNAYSGLTGMNRQAKEWVIQQSTSSAAAGSLPECFMGADGPVWMRDYSYPADVEPLDPLAQQRLDAALFVANADRMVVGHTVQSTGINAALQDKIWRIDVGVSRGVASGKPEVLQVLMENGQEVVTVLTTLQHGGVLPATQRQARAEMLWNA